MKIIFFDTKPYDKLAFDALVSQYLFKIKYLETKLNSDTVALDAGCEGVCVF